MHCSLLGIVILVTACVIALTIHVSGSDTVTATLGQSPTLPCKISANINSIVEIQWSDKDGEIAKWTAEDTDQNQPSIKTGEDGNPDQEFYILSKDNSFPWGLKFKPTSVEQSGNYTCMFTYTYETPTTEKDENGTVADNPDVTPIQNSSKVTVELTIQDKPSPPGQPSISAVMATSFRVSWQPSQTDNNSPIIRYTIHYAEKGTNGKETESKTLKVNASNANSVLINAEVFPFTNYEVWVVAENGIGESLPSNKTPVKTLEGKPSKPPTLLQIMNMSSTSVVVRWSGPELSSLNGKLTGYQLEYYHTVSPKPYVVTVVSNSSEESHIIENLQPHSFYVVQVAAKNGMHVGPQARQEFLTDEGVPSAPQILSVTNVTASGFVVRWDKPVRPNGIIIRYKVFWKQEGEEGKGARIDPEQKLEHSVRNLDPYSEYTVRVQAYTSKGGGNLSTAHTLRTDVTGPGPPSFKNLVANSSTSVIIEFSKPEEFYHSVTKFKVYYHLVGEPTLQNKVFDATDEKEDVQQVVITGLEPGSKYEFYMVGMTQSIRTSKLFEGEKSTLEVVTLDDADGKTALPPPAAASGLTGGAIAGIIVSIVLLLILVIIILLFLRRVKQRIYQPTDTEMKEDVNQPVLLMELYGKSDFQSVSTDMVPKHVTGLHADGDLGFSQEYEDICHASPPYNEESDASQEPDNKPKNRYTNILAYDRSRVALSKVQGKYSDYVNANYVDGYHRPKAYIATQGPLPNTIEDFWRMVWEQNSSIIVMITNLEEKGRRKCDQYWPKSGVKEETYGNMMVKLLSTESMAHYTIRTFTLKNIKIKKKHSSERFVIQYHYTDWPDHGVPEYTLPVLTFVTKSAFANPDGAGPIVVHCSAGVGRTGTYIVLDSMMRQIKHKNTINVAGFLKHIRRQRNFLVQTEDQYIFIHDALVDYIQKGGETEIQMEDMKNFEETMTQVDDQGETLLERQFKLITSCKPKDYEMSAAKQSYNKDKNRSQDILPVDKCRVMLTKQPGVEGSDYINASFLHGYKSINEYIITQHPLTSTIPDFWRMVWDQNSMTIVLLSTTDDEEFPVFWQEKESVMDCGHFKVTSEGEDSSQLNYIARDFLLESTQDDYELMPRIISSSYWPESCSPLSTVLEFVDEVWKWHDKKPAGPMIVIDKHGGSKAAVFCALMTLKNMVKMDDGVVDIYALAKMYHLKRPGLFEKQEDYHLIHKVVATMAEEHNVNLFDSNNEMNQHGNRHSMPAWHKGSHKKPPVENTATL